MIEIQAVTDGISCFKVPYKDIFVAIYVIRTPKGVVLFDTAATDWDVDNWIAPALQQLGVTPTHIFISHNHTDHAGGLARAAELYPDAVIMSRSPKLLEAYPNIHKHEDMEVFLDVLQTVTVPGHTSDSAAILDLRTNTLISGDCLQGFGIYGSGYWYGNITLPAQHYAAIEKLRSLPIETIAAAHDYHPCGMISRGSEEAARRLDSCMDALERVHDIAKANPQLTSEEVVLLCNDGALPKVAPKVIDALRKADDEGKL